VFISENCTEKANHTDFFLKGTSLKTTVESGKTLLELGDNQVLLVAHDTKINYESSRDEISFLGGGNVRKYFSFILI
jgi:hypothetical protein